MGSSPLTRGKCLIAKWNASSKGLIPAHAGKIKYPHCEMSSYPAHPRSRGENGWPERHIKPNQGSSPLTRGKCLWASRKANLLGLIPAHAGKIVRGHGYAARAWAHPRSRGENRSASDEHAAVGGSSPLTRGKSHGHPVRKGRPGLIPAHAGKMVDRRAGAGSWRAHPRSRGENRFSFFGFPFGLGSSPLTRGKCSPFTLIVAARGLIPAHAGKMT